MCDLRQRSRKQSSNLEDNGEYSNRVGEVPDESSAGLILENASDQQDLGDRGFEEPPTRSRKARVNASVQGEDSPSALSFDHILKTSIELDDVAKKNIEQLLALGSKRLAPDFKEMLDVALRAVEQNANLLRILRHQLGSSKDE